MTHTKPSDINIKRINSFQDKSKHLESSIKFQKDEELAHVIEHSPLILEVMGSILTPNIILGYFLSMLYQSMCW